MLTIPKKYLESLKRILEWHKRNYSEIDFIIYIEHLISAFDFANKSTDEISINLDGKSYWYYIRESVYDAKMNIPLDGIETKDIVEIHEWANENYLHSK